MDFKLFLRTLFLLLVLFVMLYIGLTNRQSVDFHFPLLLERKLTQPAALVYFGMFAVGLLTGTILTAGGKRSSGGSGPASAKRAKESR